jgi:hypothetical protein
MVKGKLYFGKDIPRSKNYKIKVFGAIAKICILQLNPGISKLHRVFPIVQFPIPIPKLF